MSEMFRGADAFNSDISSWDIGATSMNLMFSGATSLNQDLSSWDVSNVTNMFRVFNEAESFNQDISSWDVSNVTSMRELFNNSPDFNQDLSSWDVSSVTNMSKMFYNAASYNQNISSWDVSNATDMANMFYGQNSLSNANKGLIHSYFYSNSNWPYSSWSAVVVNYPPVITSYGGAATVALNAPENQAFAADVNASDPDGNATVSYSIREPDRRRHQQHLRGGSQRFRRNRMGPPDPHRDGHRRGRRQRPPLLHRSRNFHKL